MVRPKKRQPTAGTFFTDIKRNIESITDVFLARRERETGKRMGRDL